MVISFRFSLERCPAVEGKFNVCHGCSFRLRISRERLAWYESQRVGLSVAATEFLKSPRGGLKPDDRGSHDSEMRVRALRHRESPLWGLVVRVRTGETGLTGSLACRQ